MGGCQLQSGGLQSRVVLCKQSMLRIPSAGQQQWHFILPRPCRGRPIRAFHSCRPRCERPNYGRQPEPLPTFLETIGKPGILRQTLVRSHCDLPSKEALTRVQVRDRNFSGRFCGCGGTDQLGHPLLARKVVKITVGSVSVSRLWHI